MKRIFYFYYFLMVGLFFTGCAHFSRSSKMSDLSSMSAEKLRDRLEQNYLKLITLEGKAQFQAQMEGAGYEAAANVKLIMPDSLFTKFEAMFGFDVGTFSCNRKKFALYIPMQKVLYTGRLDSIDLARFFQIQITYDELMEGFTGIPRIQSGEFAPLTIENNQYLMTSRTTAGIHRYWIDATQFIVTQYQFHDLNGTLQITKNFSNFKKYNDILLPKTIQIARPAQRQMFSLFYHERKVNQPIDGNNFKIRGVPKNTRHIRL